MAEYESSTSREPEVSNVIYTVDAYSPEEGLAGRGRSECEISDDATHEGEQSLTLIERLATRPGNRYLAQQRPLTVPLLGHLVAGAGSCAIFISDHTGCQFRLEAVANLSREFISALVYKGQGGRLIRTAIEQPKPYLIIHLPGNKQFRLLEKLAHNEGIETLWLVPWRDWNGNVSGVLMFASVDTFLPGKEALASVSLLTAWISSILRQASAIPENENRGDNTDSGSEPRMSEAGANRIVAMERLMRELAGSRQYLTTDEPDEPNPGFHDASEDMATSMVPMYDDKHSIPVLYDASTQESAKSTLPDTVSVLSHELLSPLTLIKGYAATLLQLGGVIAEERKEQYLRGIESAANRVSRLLKNLRNISWLEESDTLIVQFVALPDLLRQSVSEIQNETMKHVIKLRAFGSLPMVKVDQQKVEQVITNLLTNAVKYSPQGGDIEVTIRLARDKRQLEEIFGQVAPLKLPSLIVSVSDSGIGIAEAEQERIFERFYRGNNAVTRAIPGVGLGLYICKVIVEAHGGRIWARNKPKVGSVFSFSLPVD